MDDFAPPPSGLPQTESNVEAPPAGIPNIGAPPPGAPTESPPGPNGPPEVQPPEPSSEVVATPMPETSEEPSPPTAPKKKSRKSKSKEQSLDLSEPQICERCDFWKVNNPPKGFCRKEPPKVMNSHESLWPMTQRNDWCGAYQRTAK